MLTILLYSEIMWVILYSYTVVGGIINDELVLTSTSFFLLALAGLEFCIGFILSIFFRNFKKSLDLSFNDNSSLDRDLIKKLSLNRYIWSFN
jgi:hypothetical protein